MIGSLYRLFGIIGAPVITLYLNRRKSRGKEDVARFNERLGLAKLKRPPGPLIWLHGASVGESISLLALIEKITEEQPNLTCLLTTGTVTSAALMAERLPKNVIHQYVPVDRALYVERFFDYWKPDLVLWSESDFWPNLIKEPVRRGVPIILVNGRISPKSYSKWQRFSGFARSLVAGFSLCLAQTESDVERLSGLGAKNVKYVGNLKFAVKPLPVDGEALAAVTSQLAERRRWFCASTHRGEEEIIWNVHQKLNSKSPDLISIIAPRHPNRGIEIATTLRALGARVGLRSQGDLITPETEVYLADTMGEMGLFFRTCQLVFMGKSLIDKGGQNPLEAASLDSTILYGPHMWNFQEIVERLNALGGACPIKNEDELEGALSGFLLSPETAQAIAKNAKTYVKSESGVLDAVFAELKPYLENIDTSEVKS